MLSQSHMFPSINTHPTSSETCDLRLGTATRRGVDKRGGCGSDGSHGFGFIVFRVGFGVFLASSARAVACCGYRVPRRGADGRGAGGGGRAGLAASACGGVGVFQGERRSSQGAQRVRTGCGYAGGGGPCDSGQAVGAGFSNLVDRTISTSNMLVRVGEGVSNVLDGVNWSTNVLSSISRASFSRHASCSVTSRALRARITSPCSAQM